MAKPSDLPIWNTSETNSVPTDNDRKAQGWLAPGGVPEKPPYQIFNYWQNLSYKWIEAINRLGILPWDATTTYDQTSYVVGSDGFLYRSLSASNTGNDPVSTPLSWQSVEKSEVFIAVDQKPDSQNGGTFTAGDWRTRDLNVIRKNTIPGASLSSDRITLPAGNYEVIATCPAVDVQLHQCRLYNITTTSILSLGSSENTTQDATNKVCTSSRIYGSFSLTAQSLVELQHQCSATLAGRGFGDSSNFGVGEIYSEIFIWKV